jgi:hypothetical protein
MENLNLDLAQIGTLAGLSGVTTVLTGAIKRLLNTTGHGTILAAILIALALSVAWNIDAGTLHSALDFVRVAAYSLISASVAVGIYEGVKGATK